MTLGSLFDGSGGFPLAGAIYGIEPLWCSEIEPYPVAVTKARFPNMMHYTDVSKLNGSDLKPVDIVTFGSPCQDLSIAGKRAGIKDGERSNLFFEAVRIIKEMRDATNDTYPRYAVWENVPGAFSSNKGADFHAVLSAFAEVAGWGDSIPQPFGNGRNADKLVWRKAGAILGTDWSLAWRTLDAQYWGVPQRRRRIFLIADFGGQRAPEILFERKGMSGNLETSREAGQEVAGNATGSIARSGGEGDNTAVWTIDGRNGVGNKELSGTLQAKPNGGFSYNCINPICYPNNQPVVYSFDSLSSNSMKSANPHSGCRPVDVAKCLDTTYPDPSKNQGGIAIVQPVLCLQGNGIDRADTAGCNGAGWREDASYTLNTIDRHAVCFEPRSQDGVPRIHGDISLTNNTAQGGQRQPCVVTQSTSGTVTTRVATANAPETLITYQKTTGPLMANSHPGSYSGQDAYSDMLITERKPKRRFIVRRLTPLECCRLQGFPDDWADLPTITDMTDEEWKFWEQCRADHTKVSGKNFKPKTKEQEIKWLNKLHVDSSEYKMWGNGVALPCVAFIMRNIAKETVQT